MIRSLEIHWNDKVGRYEGTAEIFGLSVEFKTTGTTIAEAVASVVKRALVATIDGCDLSRERRKFEEEVRRVFRLG